MKEVCELLRGVAADNDGANDDNFSAVLVTASTRVNGGEDTAADSLRAGMILNDVGVSRNARSVSFYYTLNGHESIAPGVIKLSRK